MNTLARSSSPLLPLLAMPAVSVSCYCHFFWGTSSAPAGIRQQTTPALTQIRGLRRPNRPPDEEKEEKKGGAENEPKSREKMAEEMAMGAVKAMKVRREFNKAYAGWVRQLIKDQFGGRGGKREKIDRKMTRFVEDFNKRLTDHEVVAPPVDEFVRKARQLALMMLANFCLALGFMWYQNSKMDSRMAHQQLIGGPQMTPERAQRVLAQPAVSMAEFLQDYLRAGEVQAIYYYMGRNAAVAILQPDAIIRGQPFTDPGVHISLHTDVGTTYDAWTFHQLLDAEQHRLGIARRDFVPVIDEVPASYFFMSYLILGLLMGVGGYKFWQFGTRARFSIVPRRKPAKKKEEGATP